MLKRNIDLGPALKLSGWRKVAIGTWRSAGDPSVYGIVELDVGPALAYIEKIREKTGAKVTLSHFVGKALATMLNRHPDINCILRFGRIYPRKHVDLFFQVATDPEGRDLSGTVIRDADKKSIYEIAMDMKARVDSIRKKGDPEYRKIKTMMAMIPGALTRFLLGITGTIMYTFNLWTPALNSPRDPFGSVMITNIGSLGLDTGFAPLVPYSRIPLIIAVGNARETPIVKDGQVIAAMTIRLCVTIDHRLIDGVHASRMSRTLQRSSATPKPNSAQFKAVCRSTCSPEKQFASSDLLRGSRATGKRSR